MVAHAHNHSAERLRQEECYKFEVVVTTIADDYKTELQKHAAILRTFRIMQGLARVYIIIPLLCRVRRRRASLKSSSLLFSESRYLM